MGDGKGGSTDQEPSDLVVWVCCGIIRALIQEHKSVCETDKHQQKKKMDKVLRTLRLKLTGRFADILCHRHSSPSPLPPHQSYVPERQDDPNRHRNAFE